MGMQILHERGEDGVLESIKLSIEQLTVELLDSFDNDKHKTKGNTFGPLMEIQSKGG